MHDGEVLSAFDGIGALVCLSAIEEGRAINFQEVLGFQSGVPDMAILKDAQSCRSWS